MNEICEISKNPEGPGDYFPIIHPGCEIDLDCGEGFNCQDRECKPDFPGAYNFFKIIFVQIYKYFLFKIGNEPPGPVDYPQFCDANNDCNDGEICSNNECKISDESGKV